MTESELNFLKLKYNLHYDDDPIDTLISSNLVMSDSKYKFDVKPELSVK